MGLFGLHKKSLALLLDPEKANLDALTFTAEAHPDYIFVGGSTGGDTTEFVRALKKKLSTFDFRLSTMYDLFCDSLRTK